MVNNQLLDYVKQQLALKVSRDVITANLKGTGWNDIDINEAFATLSITPAEAIEKVQMARVAQVEVQPEINPTTNPSHKFRKFFIVLVIIILLGAIGGGVYAYYTGAFVSLPSLVTQSIDSAKAATGTTYDTTVTVDFSGVQSFASGLAQLAGGVSLGKATITTKGSYDFSDANNKKGSAVVSLDLGALSLAGEARVVNNTLYGVLTKVPTISFFPMLPSLENKWFSVSVGSGSDGSVNNPFSSITLLNSNITDKLTADQQAHIYEMTKNAHFIKMVQRFSPETAGGELSYHFSFDLDRDGINTYLQSLKSYINTIGSNDSALSAFDPTTLNQSLDQIKNFSGEVWIGRNDKLLHKIMLNFGVQPDKTKDEQVNISMVGIFSNWNQPTSIIAPDNSVPFQTLISSMMPSTIAPTPTKPKTTIKTTK